MKYEILFCFVVFFLVFVLPEILKAIELIYKPDACNCKDVTQCDKWCIGKENYTKAQYSITEVCKHPDEDRIIRVLESVAGCETTIVECGACGVQLTKPKTEC